MAWISLAIVAIYFFAPGIGRGPEIMASGVPLIMHLPGFSVAFQIPFTGPLRLFIYSCGTWLILWQGIRLIEKVVNEDFLSRLHIPHNDLRNDLVNAFLPVISNQIAVKMAQIMIWFLVIKAIFLALLQLIIAGLIPFLATRFPVETISIVSSLLEQGETFLFSLTTQNIAVGFIFAVLILLAQKGHELEQRERYIRDIRQNQIARKQTQIDLVIPVTQR